MLFALAECYKKYSIGLNVCREVVYKFGWVWNAATTGILQ